MLKKKQAQCKNNVILRCVRVNIVRVENQLSVTYSKHLFKALVIRYAKRMRRIILSSACLYRIFPQLPHEPYNFGKKKEEEEEEEEVLWNTKRVC